MSDNSNSLEDFACLGRNLYNLLINSSLQRNPQQIAEAPAQTNGNNPAELGRTAPRMGLYSHGTAHTFLGSAAGNDLTRSFKMPTVIKMVDKLKAKLLRENPVPEWELLEDDAWTPDDALDDGVLVGGTPNKGQPGVPGHRFGIESYMSVNTVKSGSSGDHNSRVPNGAVAGREREREKGTSGWTKIKPR